jgi:hypothetical protein
MDGKLQRRLMLFLLLLVSGGVVVSQTGCIGLAAHVIYAIRGNKVKAEYSGLEKKRVAVICVSSASTYGPDNAAERIANAVRMTLAQQNLKIDFVRQNEINDWLDGNWEDIDYVEIGKAVKADRVVAIDMESYSLYEGTTLFKGRSGFTVSVFDMEQGGQQVFGKGPREFEYPKSTVVPATSTSERQFEQYFVMEMGAEVARYFYDYDFPETIARDAAHIGR